MNRKEGESAGTTLGAGTECGSSGKGGCGALENRPGMGGPTGLRGPMRRLRRDRLLPETFVFGQCILRVSSIQFFFISDGCGLLHCAFRCLNV